MEWLKQAYVWLVRANGFALSKKDCTEISSRDEQDARRLITESHPQIRLSRLVRCDGPNGVLGIRIGMMKKLQLPEMTVPVPQKPN